MQPFDFTTISLLNNRMGTLIQGLGASGVGSKVWVLTIGVLEVNPERDSVRDGLWRPGGAFFQIGLACVMSHHHRVGLCTYSCLLFGGKIQIGVPANSLRELCNVPAA